MRRYLRGWTTTSVLAIIVIVAIATAAVTALLVNIFERKTEARQTFVRLVEVDEDAEVSEETLELVFRGDKTRMIQPCAACHGAQGQGAIIDVPAISGQNVKYFVDTMKDYARDKRENDIYSRMRIIAKSLTRDEIEELAVYYAKLGNRLAGGGNKQANAE